MNNQFNYRENSTTQAVQLQHFLGAFFMLMSSLLVIALGSATANAGVSSRDLAEHASYSNPQLSPDGKTLVVTAEIDDAPNLVFIDIATRQPTQLVEFTKESLPADYQWANDERLVVSMGRRIGSADVPFLTGELFALNKNGKRKLNIFGPRAKNPTYGVGRMMAVLDDRHILVEVTPYSRTRMDKLTEIHRVNIYNGKNRRVIRSDLRGAAFMLDRDNEPRFAVGADDNAEQIISVKAKGSRDWQKFDSPFEGDVVPVAFEEDNETVYLIAAGEEDKSVTGIYSLNIKTKATERVYHSGDTDIEGVLTDPDQNLLGAITFRNYPEFIAIDKEHPLTQLAQGLIAAFPDDNVGIVSISDANDRAVVSVSSPSRTPEYFLYDKAKGGLEPLFDAYPNIDDSRLSPSDAFTIKARDGLTLHGYVTVPKGSNGKQPLVVMPHGGPHARDYWGYDPLVQLLAVNGYAVLQVNFRGSTGFGQDFMEAGYGEWGRKIQYDIIDAVQWSIDEGIADPDRIAIFGASFGGYSALQAPALAPELFKAAIGYVGVYDLDMLYTTGDIEGARWGGAYLDKTLPESEQERRAQSPVDQLDKFDAAIFIVHGKEDFRAAFEHAEVLRDKLDDMGRPYEWLAKDGEGHGFYNVDNRTELNDKVLVFLDKHIGVGAAQP